MAAIPYRALAIAYATAFVARRAVEQLDAEAEGSPMPLAGYGLPLQAHVAVDRLEQCLMALGSRLPPHQGHAGEVHVRAFIATIRPILAPPKPGPGPTRAEIDAYIEARDRLVAEGMALHAESYP